MIVQPTVQLMAEHEQIKIMLEILDSMSDRLDAGQRVDPEHLEKALEFIEVFADSCHHAKEEDLLFVEMEKAGIPSQEGPVAIMRAEHDLGRAFVSGLADAVNRYKAGDPGAAADAAENLRGYIGILSQHIPKEDTILYPLANSRLSDEQQQMLEAEFEKVEAERIGPGKHEEFEHLLEELGREYLA